MAVLGQASSRQAFSYFTAQLVYYLGAVNVWLISAIEKLVSGFLFAHLKLIAFNFLELGVIH